MAPLPPVTPFNVFLNTRGGQFTTLGVGLTQAPPAGGPEGSLEVLFNNPTYGATGLHALRIVSRKDGEPPSSDAPARRRVIGRNLTKLCLGQRYGRPACTLTHMDLVHILLPVLYGNGSSV